jgi:hypothetical protein
MQPSARNASDISRSVGGLLLAAGAVVLLIRKASHHEWSNIARLLLILVPAVLLYVLALNRNNDERSQPWQSLLAVASILLWPIALFQVLETVGANTSNSLLEATVFALTALIAINALQRARVRYAALLAGLALLLTWLFTWNEALHPSANTTRWLLVAAALVLIGASIALDRRTAIGAGEIATAGGVAAVAAGLLGVVVGAFVGVTRTFLNLPGFSEESSSFSAVSSRSGTHSAGEAHSLTGLIHIAHTSGLQHFGWDLYLLVVSATLTWAAARWRIRGLGYVGGLGLIGFIVSVSLQITRIQAGKLPTSSLLNWPLVLIVLGALGLAAPLLSRSER